MVKTQINSSIMLVYKALEDNAVIVAKLQLFLDSSW
jgi:hypothetical protein